MPLATAVNAFDASPVQTPDGVRWLQVVADADIYPHFKRLPEVCQFDGRLYRKCGFNSDSFLIHYREVSEKKVAIPV